ncbi:unnamed protein product [Hymenolepis diminuta]|uniref:DUF1907 domain-containing protein n=1 Tax=Hymenolepis diminuta TaxID=6216 RepID=A0A0R3SNY4_HYMDI|nr:unnamed protein product [Hymenolepis diminuta]
MNSAYVCVQKLHAALPYQIFSSEFPDHPVDTPERVAAFLKYFEMEPPVLGVGTLVSHDPVRFNIRYKEEV